jgi:histidine ammonia-lyase
LLVIDGTSLTCAALACASLSRVTVMVAPQARNRVQRSFDYAIDAAAQRPVYGRSTGVGANRTIEVSVDDAGQSMRLLRSHATAGGLYRDARRVRALLVVRLNQLANGGSGIDPAVLDGLADLINTDTLPRVRELGGIGTGDMSALARVALVLCGDEPIDGAAVAPVRFGPGDALPFLSSNAATIADAALAWSELSRLAEAAVVVAAISFLAVRGNSEALDPAVASVSPFAGVRQVADVVATLVRPAPQAARLQDPYAFRALPQVHGTFLDALSRLREIAEAMANVASENPLIRPDADSVNTGVLHHGGFHAAQLAQALDAVNTTVVPAARLGLTRLTALSSPTMTGARPFLADDIPGSSGVMMLEYVAASALGELLVTAHPVETQSVTLSLGAEEGANFAPAAARAALRAGESYAVIIAAELMAAVRAIRLSGAAGSGRMADVMAACAALPAQTPDRDLSADLDAAVALLPTLHQFFDELR